MRALFYYILDVIGFLFLNPSLPLMWSPTLPDPTSFPTSKPPNLAF